MDWPCEEDLRILGISKEALEFAYKEHIFKEIWTVKDVPYDVLCKLIEIYLIKEYSKNRF